MSVEKTARCNLRPPLADAMSVASACRLEICLPKGNVIKSPYKLADVSADNNPK